MNSRHAEEDTRTKSPRREERSPWLPTEEEWRSERPVVRCWPTGQIGEGATGNSPCELTVGSSSKGKPTLTRALTAAAR
jgi:hypothetical protein